VDHFDSLFVCICLHNYSVHSYLINSLNNIDTNLPVVIINKLNEFRGEFLCFPLALCNFTVCKNSISAEVSEFDKNCPHTYIVRHPKVSGASVTPDRLAGVTCQ
jgi:hypothetical protein